MAESEQGSGGLGEPRRELQQRTAEAIFARPRALYDEFACT